MPDKRPPEKPVAVMLARAVDALPDGHASPGGVQYEQNWDGYRLVGFSTAKPYLQSRRGADPPTPSSEIAAAVATMGDVVVVDGELVHHRGGHRSGTWSSSYSARLSRSIT
jgi:ATP-dependent DNA ligase